MELVAKFLAGFNTTLLAYGQTGSGKTYTMGIDGELRPNRIPDARFMGKRVTPLVDLFDGTPCPSCDCSSTVQM